MNEMLCALIKINWVSLRSQETWCRLRVVLTSLWCLVRAIRTVLVTITEPAPWDAGHRVLTHKLPAVTCPGGWKRDTAVIGQVIWHSYWLSLIQWFTSLSVQLLVVPFDIVAGQVRWHSRDLWHHEWLSPSVFFNTKKTRIAVVVSARAVLLTCLLKLALFGKNASNAEQERYPGIFTVFSTSVLSIATVTIVLFFCLCSAWKSSYERVHGCFTVVCSLYKTFIGEALHPWMAIGRFLRMHLSSTTT